jgi:phosphatidylglycerol:prolipoprotein diacylglycerol transferase
MQEYILIYGTSFSSWYAFAFLATIVGCAVTLLLRPKDFQVDAAGLAVLCLLAVILAYSGGYFVSFMIRWPVYVFHRIPHPFRTATGGYAFLGKAGGVALAALVFAKCRKKKMSFLMLMDYGSPLIMLSQSIVRIGCFAQGCCSGRPTDLPWGCIFHGKLPPRHPTQVYEIIYLLFIFVVMRNVYRKNPPTGTVFFGTFLLYGFFRFFNEFLRFDGRVILGPITFAHLTMAALVIVCAAGLLKVRHKGDVSL